MDFGYTEEQEAIRQMVRSFAENEIEPGAEERDRTGAFDYDLYRRLGELGICGMRFPEEFGGSDADFLAWCLALEEIGRKDLSLSWSLFVGTGAASRIISLGSPEQIEAFRDKWITPIIRGEAVGGGAITEPGAGSDTRNIQTLAIQDGEEWVINGAKAFITNAGLDICAVFTVVCLTDKQKKEFESIMVPVDAPGFRVMPPYRKMGLRSSYTAELSFDNCRVPVFNALGERGSGRANTVQLLATARVSLSSTALGLHLSCYEQALVYAKMRVAFKRPIFEFQHVQAMLVDMALELELSRMLRDKAALLIDQGKPHMKEAAMAKYFCCEAAARAANSAVQIHGAMGFMDECAVSRYYRDIRAATIADGTTQIQKWIIAREIGKD
jgi:alkylation response protein AidB-like acyl-CoA dehydrogenase